MLGSEKMLRLIGSIYDAAEDASMWSGVLTEMADALRSADACIVSDDVPSGKTNVVASARMDPDGVALYNQHYYSVDLFIKNGRARQARAPVSVIASHEGIEDQALLRSEFYQDFLRRYDLFYDLGATVSDDASVSVTYCSFHRSLKRGPFRQEEMRWLRLLMPHLERSLAIRQRLAFGRAAESALNVMAVALAIVGASGKVLFMNDAARRIFSSGDGLFLDKQEKLSVWARASRIDEAIRLSAATSDGKGVSPGFLIPVERPSGKRPYAVRVSPIHAPASFSGPENAKAAVYISDPEQGVGETEELLRTGFGLTRSEAAVALRLLNGLTLENICDEMSVRLTTGRTHIRRILDKLGVRRQAQAVALLSRALRMR